MLLSSELAAEAERRSKAVLESQDMQLSGLNLRAKGQGEALPASYGESWVHEKFTAPGARVTVGERQVSARTTCISGHAGNCRSLMSRSGCWRTIAKPS